MDRLSFKCLLVFTVILSFELAYSSGAHRNLGPARYKRHSVNHRVLREVLSMKKAACILRGNATGVIKLAQEAPEAPTTISGAIKGLSPGQHGFHIHQFGDLTGGCKSAGGHYNPQRMTHGAPNDAVRHIGDLGNILADETGVANVYIIDHEATLFGDLSVIGRAIVVHAHVDDLGRGGNEGSLKTGNAGSRVACGVIGLSP